MPGRPDDGAAAALPDRQGARRPPLSRGQGLRRDPEGAARRAARARKKVFVGLGFGAAFKSLQAVFGGVKGVARGRGAGLPRRGGRRATSRPSCMGVGYIIGWRTSLMMVAGSLLASFVLIPAIVVFGSGLAEPLAPATELDLRDVADRGLVELRQAHRRGRRRGGGRVRARARAALDLELARGVRRRAARRGERGEHRPHGARHARRRPGRRRARRSSRSSGSCRRSR